MKLSANTAIFVVPIHVLRFAKITYPLVARLKQFVPHTAAAINTQATFAHE